MRFSELNVIACEPSWIYTYRKRYIYIYILSWSYDAFIKNCPYKTGFPIIYTWLCSCAENIERQVLLIPEKNLDKSCAMIPLYHWEKMSVWVM